MHHRDIGLLIYGLAIIVQSESQVVSKYASKQCGSFATITTTTNNVGSARPGQAGGIGGSFTKSKCFQSKSELMGAITTYVNEDCTHYAGDCSVGLTYGYPMNQWCVEDITDMSNLFSGMAWFNEVIDGWDTGSVTDMSNMFARAERFMGDISCWDTSRVEDMSGMYVKLFDYICIYIIFASN